MVVTTTAAQRQDDQIVRWAVWCFRSTYNRGLNVVIVDITEHGVPVWLGCFKDDRNDRDLRAHQTSFNDNTPARCVKHCFAAGEFDKNYNKRLGQIITKMKAGNSF